jgi:[protein-PII] uridylyltransferase
VEHKFLTEQECQTLLQGQAFLWKVRWGLHTLAGRREDRLLFDHQKTLANLFGYQDTANRRAVEHFMKEYYVTIMELSRLNEMLLQLFQEAILYAEDTDQPQILNKRFQIRKGFIEVTHENVFLRYPFALLEIFLLLQQNPQIHGVRATTIRLLRNHRYLIDDKFRNDLRNRSLFMEIMRQPVGITHELRRMNRYGILAAYIPAFAKVVGLMQFDLFHVYTVDEHSLMVLRNLRRFTVPQFANEVPFCSKLIQTIPRPDLLYLGGLFHDIAKGRGGDHSKLGAQEAMQFCLHHGLSNYDARLVGWLVKNHLIMSSTAQRQDISDPDVITAFAQQMGDQTHLDYLFLLTCADIRATNPELWNGWKYALLTELYRATRRALWRGTEHPIEKQERLAEIQLEAREFARAAKLSEVDIDVVWKQFNDEYFLRHTPEEIGWHTNAIHTHTGELPLISVQEDKEKKATSIFVYTRDVEYLFAAITQTLSQMGLNIVDARIMTTESGLVLDTFTVLDANGEPLHDPFQITDIQSRLTRAVSQPTRQAAVARRPRPRRLQAFSIPIELTFSTDVIKQRTVMELIASDRPGLLSLVGRALAECDVSLHSAKIGTFGERVEDVFFLTDKNKRPLQNEAQFACLRNHIQEFLDEQVT